MQSLKTTAVSTGKRLYVETMMQVVGRALEAISIEDDSVRRELAGFPDGFTFSMRVIGKNGPGLNVRRTAKNTFRYEGSDSRRKPDLVIYIKHVEHAFRVLTFQESTARAFANDRMLVDGEISYAIRMVRVLNRLESFILPKPIAQLAVKEYPSISLPRKVYQGARIYSRVVTSFVSEQVRRAA